MLIRQLEYLVALAQQKHFAHAAERCDISQPALSLAIKNLESELGVAIVARGNRFQGFTPEGEIVLNWARRILRDEETLKEELRCCAGSLSGRVRLGVIPSATAVSAKLAAAFAAEHPGVSFAELEMTSVDMLYALSAFNLDCGITYIDNEPVDRVRTLPIGHEEYVLVTPSDSPLASVTKVTWASAATLPLCLLHRDMQNRRILDAVFESVGARPEARIETNSMLGKYCYLQLGWSTVMPRSMVDWLPPPPLMRVLPLVEPTVKKALGLIIADHATTPPLLKAFHAFVQAQTGRLDRRGLRFTPLIEPLLTSS